MAWSGPTPDEAGYILRQQRERAARQPRYDEADRTPWLYVLGAAAVAAWLFGGTGGDAPSGGAGGAFAGTWRGEVVQSGQAPYPVVVDFAPDGTAAVDYPTLPCSAVLTPTGAVSGGHGFREDVTAGSCASGTVRLISNTDGSLSYEGSFPGETTTGSTGTLRLSEVAPSAS